MTPKLLRSALYLFVLTMSVCVSSSCDPCKRCFKKLDARLYRPNEMLITYKKKPTDKDRDTIKQKLQEAGIDIDSLKIRKCNNCNEYVELWHADKIETTIHADGIQAGTVSKSGSVGEDGLAHYALNYILYLPVDVLPDTNKYEFDQRVEPMPRGTRDPIIIAVLDTGLDTEQVVNSAYLWKNPGENGANSTDDDKNCYTNDVHGWNFINESQKVKDDNKGLHGTHVSQFIISQFEAHSGNFPHIMTLKTHDKGGSGDLFSAICAIHYAIDKKVDIINASWGFYYYENRVHPYLDSLITQVLKKEGILFITASGNKIAKADSLARETYQLKYNMMLSDEQLRNLEVHNFYPACLATDSNNVMVATTTDGSKISETQNYSSFYVDFGVMTDHVESPYMMFKAPHTTSPVFISGSSFATAILTGKIGALTAKAAYESDLNKKNIISNLDADESEIIHISEQLKNEGLVKDGKYIERE